MIRQFEILGEAAKNIPVNIRNKNPEVDWKRIVGLRDVLIHSYFGIDLEIIWGIIKNNLPSLDHSLRKMIDEI